MKKKNGNAGIIRDDKGRFTKDSRPPYGFKKGNQMSKGENHRGGLPQVYTEKYIEDDVIKMLKEVIEDDSIVFIKQLFINRKYSNEHFHTLKAKYSDNNLIQNTYKQVQEIIESRLVSGGVHGKTNSPMTQFVLKNKYGWRDKTEHEVTGNVNISLLELVNLRKKQIEEANLVDGEVIEEEENEDKGQ